MRYYPLIVAVAVAVAHGAEHVAFRRAQEAPAVDTEALKDVLMRVAAELDSRLEGAALEIEGEENAAEGVSISSSSSSYVFEDYYADEQPDVVVVLQEIEHRYGPTVELVVSEHIDYIREMVRIYGREIDVNALMNHILAIDS